MSSASHLLHGVTEARGSYNKHAASQAAGGALALPLLRKAAQAVALNADDRAIIIADYGSSQGKNSLAPMRAAIAVLRRRLLPRRSICVVHVDVAENDFSTLFDVVDNAADGYASSDPDVFPSAVGRSFYRSVLPQGHVHLGWSSYAAVWLSRAPTIIPGHFWILSCAGATRAAFERQAARDWEAFLALRARELRAGGRLVVTLPAARDDGASPVNDRMDLANTVLAEMVADHAITADERARMILLAYPRRESELLAPFARAKRFEGLVLEQFETTPVSEPDWDEYERDRDCDKLAAKQTGFFRATFMPSLASALAPERSAEDHQRFIDRMADGLKQKLIEEPKPLGLRAQVIVLAKELRA
jgi:hypothetical protein